MMLYDFFKVFFKYKSCIIIIATSGDEVDNKYKNNTAAREVTT